MKTVKEVSKITGVSVRTLHHYDAIGLLKPARVTEAGYRLYDDAALERLSLILLFREIGLALKDIRGILDAPDFDRNRVLDRQITLMEQKMARLESMTTMAQGIKQIGVKHLELNEFNFHKIDDYTAQARTLYGKTEAYKQWEQKAGNRTDGQNKAINGQVMDFFVRLGQMQDQSPGSEAVQTWVKELQAFFTEHFYNCTPQILRSLGQMYADGGSFTENIDNAGGKGTAEFAHQAIEIYCKNG